MKNYLIIGASSGIGKQLAKNLMDSGNMVYGTFKETAIEDSNKNFSSHYLDVLDHNFNLDFLPETLDGLAYCPGTINLKPFHRVKPEDFVQDFKLQVLGAVKAIQAALPKLKQSDSASIVLFSTVAVQSGFNLHSIVSTSKGAIEGLTRSLAAELAPKIRVNSIAPSLTDTPLAQGLLSTPEKREANAQRNPLKRIGDVEDIANMAEFLLSHKAKWITGQIIHVDGGMPSLKL